MFILGSRKLNSGEKIRLVWDRVGNPLFCSKLLILKSDCVRFALVALYKRATMSKLLLLLCKKEQHGWFARASRESLSKMSDLLKKIHIFLFVFDSFSLLFPFLCPRANRSHRSLLSRSFLKSYRSDLLSSLFTKERPWGNHSQRSLQKSDHERLAPFAHDKRETGAICSFLQANRSLAYKNQVIC